MTLLQHHAFAEILTFLTTSLLGSFVLWRDPKRALNRVFFFYSLSIAGWSLSESLALLSSDPQTAYRWLYCEIFPVDFIGTLFLHFNYLLSGKPLNQTKKLILRIFYCVSLSISVLSAVMPKMIYANVRASHYIPYFVEPGPFYSVHMSAFLMSTILGNVELLSLYMRSQGEERRRLKYFVWSTVLGYIGGSPDWFLGYGIYIPGLNPFGIYAIPLYVVLTSYAILQHRLFEINLVIRRSLIYSILVTLLTVGYFGLVYGIEKLFQITFGYHSTWISLTAFALMALLFQPLKVGIQRLVDWLIFRVPQEEIIRRMERLEDQALQTEKLKAISTLAAGMAHEIKNPLTAIKTFAEFIPEKQHDPVFLKKLHEVLTSETQRIQEVVQELLEFAKPKTPHFKSVDISQIINSTVDFLSNDLLKYRIQWTISSQHDGVTIQADPDQLRQIFINLIQNAADAMPNGGTLTLTTQAHDGYLELTITDTGEGIPKELLPKIFDPFVTTKPNGTGLGLAMVQTLVRAHHGSISVASTPTRGTTFTLRFPL